MKIMTFNVLHCMDYFKRKIDFEAMAKVITDCDPDIVGLNEIRGKGSDPEYQDQVPILSELTGLKYHHFGEAIKFHGRDPYGNGFLSKRPILSVETIIIPDPDDKIFRSWYETRCIIKARLEGGITVLVTHVGLNPDEKVNAIKTIVANLEEEKCILMGDFNIQPGDPLLRPIYDRMQDAASVLNEPLFSWPSDNPTMKIDYIFVSKDIEIVNADIPAMLVSDHRPHTATVNIPNK